jgi:tripeptidyl-peptidase-1
VITLSAGTGVNRFISAPGCDSYSLPRNIADVLDIITPTVQPDVDLAAIQQYVFAIRSRHVFFRNFSPALVGESPVLVSIDGGGFFQISVINICAQERESGSIEPVETSDFDENDWILEYAMTLTQPQPAMF